MHPQLLKRSDGQRDRGEDRNADVLDEHVLARRRPTLHAVENDHVGARLHGERYVEVGAGRADLDVDRLLPVGDLPQLLDLDLEVVGAGPVGVPAGAALVDALGQVSHLGDPVGDLLAEQHASAARLGALADDDLDRVRPPQVVGVHAVARGQDLVDELGGVVALLGQHPAVAGGGGGADGARAAAERLLGRRRQRSEAHAGDRDRDVQLDRPLREPGPEGYVGRAALAVALEGVARDAGAEEEQIVEVGHAALGAEAADVVDPLAGHAVDLVDGVAVEELRLAQPGARAGHQYAPALSISKL